MTKKKYELTPEHREQLKPWADKWIANAMSTKQMDEQDKSEMRKAVKGLYEAAGLKAPPDERIVFVPSPFIMRFAAGFAAALWHIKETGFKPTWAATGAATRAATGDATRAATWDATGDATRAATGDATWDATWAATRAATRAATGAATRAATRAATGDATRAATGAATWAATGDATRAATGDATWDATRAATRAATGDATWDATWAATRAATRAATGAATWDATWAATWTATRAATRAATGDATGDATRAATGAATRAATGDATWDVGKQWYSFPIDLMAHISNELGLGKFGLECANNANNMWQGGNQWSSESAYLSFFREIANLDIAWEKWIHWEKASIHGGPRIMHKEFCIISDRPEILLVDSQNQPHAEGGPFCRWRDGSALYAYHGVRLPAHIGSVPPSEWNPEWVLESDRADMRALLVAGMGPKKFIEGIGGKCIDHFYSKVNHSVKGNWLEQLLNPFVKKKMITQIVELFEPDFTKEFNPTNKFRVLHLQCPSTGQDHYHWVPQALSQLPKEAAQNLREKGVPEQIVTARDAYRVFWKGKQPEDWLVEA